MIASTQSLTPLKRLLWKEYRAQRALWLVLFFSSLASQVVIRIVLRNSSESERSVWSIVGLIPMLFSVASAAIAFAGEREERTNDLLIQLAVPPYWTLFAKWGFMVAASLAMTLFLSLAALVLSGTSLVAVTKLADIGDWFIIFGCIFLWGSLGSLMSRRVVTSVPVMGFWCVLSIALPFSILSFLFGPIGTRMEGTDWIWPIAFCGIGAIVAVADAWLGWRWCHGKYFDAQVMKEWIGGWNRIQKRTVSISRLPTQLESQYAWWRTWQRLIWQERRRESLHSTLLIIACVGGFINFFDRPYYFNVLVGIYLIALFPLTMGILGFRYDDEGQPLRFLANRGLSPLTIWMAKHAVWLPRAICLPIVIFAVSYISALRELFRNSGTPLSWQVFEGMTVSRCLLPEALWYLLLSYATGQFAAMLIRKTAIVIAVGVLLNLLFAIWLLLMVFMDIPRWWSVGGIVCWMGAVTWWYSDHWLVERRSSSILIRLAAASVIPPFLLLGTAGAWRALEIGGVGPISEELLANSRLSLFEVGLQNSNGEKFGSFTARSEARSQLKLEIARQSQPKSMQAQQALETLEKAMQGVRTATVIPPKAAPNVEMVDVDPAEILKRYREKFFLENESNLASIMWLAERENCALPNETCLQLLLEAGRLRTEQGRLVDALDYYCASLRVATIRATGTSTRTKVDSDNSRQFTMQRIITWANHPKQTRGLLLTAVRRIHEEFALFPTPREILIAKYREEVAWVNDMIENGFLDAVQNSMPDDIQTNQYGGVRLAIVDASLSLPWERVRAFRLLERELVQRDVAASQVVNELLRPGREIPHRVQTSLADIYSPEERLRFTTPLAPMEWSTFNWRFETTIMERETFHRISLLALSLMAWKHDHKEWPSTLDDLLTNDAARMQLPATTLNDPWSGEPFRYAGNRLNQQGAQASSAVLLTTVGPNNLRDVYVDRQPQSGASFAPGASIAIRNWQGLANAAKNNERFQLQIVDGQLALFLPNEKRISN